MQDLTNTGVICRSDPLRFNIEIVLVGDSCGGHHNIHVVYDDPKLHNLSRVEHIAPYFAFGDIPERNIVRGRWLREGWMHVEAALYDADQENGPVETSEIMIRVQTEGCLR